ncbi:hypothetical protein J3R83DRAFT_5678 [Lanmaoa asiatica]|nr:hypothetical protein J3R83DRAFT_5678 [Lanmaoa asiatica]
MLATLQFLKAQDDRGNDVEFEPQFTPTTTSWVAFHLFLPSNASVLIHQPDVPSPFHVGLCLDGLRVKSEKWLFKTFDVSTSLAAI